MFYNLASRREVTSDTCQIKSVIRLLYMFCFVSLVQFLSYDCIKNVFLLIVINFFSYLVYIFFTALLAVAARRHHIDDMKLESNSFIMVIKKVSAHANYQETTEQ